MSTLSPRIRSLHRTYDSVFIYSITNQDLHEHWNHFVQLDVVETASSKRFSKRREPHSFIIIFINAYPGFWVWNAVGKYCTGQSSQYFLFDCSEFRVLLLCEFINCFVCTKYVRSHFLTVGRYLDSISIVIFIQCNSSVI